MKNVETILIITIKLTIRIIIIIILGLSRRFSLPPSASPVCRLGTDRNMLSQKSILRPAVNILNKPPWKNGIEPV